MNLRQISQLFSLRDVRNGILGLSVVFGGLGLTLFTLWAHQTGNTRLAGIAAAVSLLFVVFIIIFIVPPLARNASREASQMNLPFEFASGGAVMLGLIAIVGFSAWNTGNNLLFLVLSFMVAAMIVGFFAGSLCLKKLDVRMRFPETIFAGQETPILVSLQNRKRVFGSYSVVAEVRGRERERSIAADELEDLLPARMANWLSKPPVVRRTLNHFAFVPRNSTVEEKTVHVFDRRGHFTIKDFELSTKFPFGFFRHRRRLPAKETELVVFPEIKPYEPDLEIQPLDAGKFVANKRGLGHDLLSLRDYQPNDDLRRIDWKATARSRRLTVREFTAEDDKRVTIVLDPRLPESAGIKLTLREKIEAEQKGESFPLSSRFEQGVSLAASMISYFTEEQAEVRLVIGSDAGEFGIGPRHLYDCLRRLATIDPKFTSETDQSELEGTIERMQDDPDSGYCFLITATDGRPLSPEIASQLKIVGF